MLVNFLFVLITFSLNAFSTAATTQHEKYSNAEFFWSVFSRIRSEYGDLLRESPYSLRMWGNTDQKNSEYGHFSRNAILYEPYSVWIKSPLLLCWHMVAYGVAEY